MTPDDVRVDGPTSSIVVATAFGPRIVGLETGGRNLFAELGDEGVMGPGGAPYRFRGGHRLWVGPEDPPITYQPDDRPCEVSREGSAVRIDAPVDGANFEKSIEIVPTSGGWIVDHIVTNRGPDPVTIAPWAITQLRTGGRFALGFAGVGDGVQADRALVLWPYTDPTDPRMSLATQAVIVDARSGPPLKVGVAGDEARYEVSGTTFTKRIERDPQAACADMGATVQAYVHERFCELETLGPLVTLMPGERTTHREAWFVS